MALPRVENNAARGTGPLSCEICVIGGGPAGSAVARRLALLGHGVCLVERSAFPRPHIGESLPPSVLPVLQALDLRQPVEQAGFLRPQGTVVHWIGTTRSSPYPPQAAGFQVERGRFDTLLLEAARAVAVRVLQPVQARRPIPSEIGWTIPLRGDTPYSAVSCRYLVDAAGKYANLPRLRQRYAPRTVAWYGYWRTPALSGAETRVEAADHAWYWAAPLPDGAVNAAVFLDAAQCTGLSSTQREARYRGLLAASKLLRGCLRGRLLGRVEVCDASCYRDVDPITATAIKVGEAGFSIDPLSSQGVQAALVTALQASVAVHTLLVRPENNRLAMAFYRDSQNHAVARHRRFSAGFYAARQRYRPSPYWCARAADAPTEERPPTERPPLPPSQRLRLADQARVGPVPVIDNDLVVAGLALSHPGLDRPVAFLGDVPLAQLLDQAPWGQTAQQIVRHWSDRWPRQRCADILHWLWTRSLVVPV